MDLAGGDFYTSATFWAGAGVAAVLVIGIATIWVTLRAANPKRQLIYAMPVVTPLLTMRRDLPQDIEVRRAGYLLKSPHVVNVELRSRGRHDISRAAFDGGKPLCLDVGVPVIECLDVTTDPPDRPELSWEINGSELLIGPSLIGRRQTTVFSLLVDGQFPHLVKPQQTLIDVNIRPWDPALNPNSLRYIRLIVTVVLCTLSAVAGLWLSGYIHKQ